MSENKETKTSKKIQPEGCQNCVKKSGTRCHVILEPRYFWDKYGDCFAKSTDPIFAEKTRIAIEKYNEVKNGLLSKKTA